MYGLVNKAVHDLVVGQFGVETWELVKQQAGVTDDMFISMDAYPDDVTYRLVGAASEVLNLTPAQVLEAFGGYWVHFTGHEGYGDMLRMSGATLPEFLGNLDQLHSHVGMIMPHLQPPSFRITDHTETSLRLHYHSDRAGLAPMVVGLIKGLGTMFGTPVAVTMLRSREDGADHEEFLVEYAA